MRKRLGIILFVRQHQAWTSVKCLQTADPLFLAPSMLLAQVYRHWWCINVSEPNRSAPLSRLPDPDIWLRIGPISDFSIGSGAVCATPVSLQPLSVSLSPGINLNLSAGLSLLSVWTQRSTAVSQKNALNCSSPPAQQFLTVTQIGVLWLQGLRRKRTWFLCIGANHVFL